MKIKTRILSYLFVAFLICNLAGCAGATTSKIANTISDVGNKKNFVTGTPVTPSEQTNKVDKKNNTVKSKKTNNAYSKINKTKLETDSGYSKEIAPFEIRMLDVGQGLAVLIKSGKHYMLYDGGGRSYSSYVVSYLQKNNIMYLDYMVASHYDEDHINGLVGVLNTTTIGKAITPDYETDSQIYRSFRNMLSKNGAAEEHPNAGNTYKLGSATVEVLGPDNYQYENENNYSVVLKVSYGNFSCILSGDAEKEAENDMVSMERDILDTDLYIVGHHGSSSSSSDAFVKAMSPTYAFISVGKGNSYGHPTNKTLSTLKKNNCEIFRTDQQGEVTMYSDGKKIWSNTNATVASVSATEKEKIYSTKKPASKEKTSNKWELHSQKGYVLNRNTMKFHNMDCSCVKKMNDNNKAISDKSKKELISEGYTPCGICNP